MTAPVAVTAEKKLQPIIVRRVHKAAPAGHMGTWKIAYADFVTAMMAFFLLLWLLGSTAKGDLQEIAAYFAAPLGASMVGTDGAGRSSSVIPAGGEDLTKALGQSRRSGAQASGQRRIGLDAEYARQDRQRIEALRAKFDALMASNPRLNEYRSQIRIRITPDGLQIQIIDEQNRPMFDSGSARVLPHMRDILHAIGAALGGVKNRISLAGHTDAVPYGKYGPHDEPGYSNWELSADRANASRRELVSAGMPDDQLGRVVGLAASAPLEPDDPLAPANRRISITVLTHEAEERLMARELPAITATQLLHDAQARPALHPEPPRPAPSR